VAMSWGEEFVSGRDGQGQALLGINALTQPGFCPDAKQPELKFAAVAVQRLALPWRLSGAVWCALAEVAATRSALRALMGEFDYAHCVPVAGAGREDGAAQEGWRFEAASAEAPPAALLARVAQALGLAGTGVLRYADSQRGRSRLLRLAGEGAQARLQSLLLVGEAGVAAWLLPLWRDAVPVAPVGRQLLAPEPSAPAGVAAAARSPQVCNCFDVSEARIRESLSRCSGSPAERLSALQGELRCGTQCGSCLPSLRRLVAISSEEVMP
jgi:assimilatory nitrate reductase catalytic subunit